MDSLVLGLLVSLACVLGLAFAFFVIYRHHLRRLRRSAKSTSESGSGSSGSRGGFPFQMPSRWMAIRSSNTALVLGGRLVDPAQDIDALYRMLNRLSRELGEVHFYASDRVLQFHTWARLDDGRVTRAYSWAGETQWNEGRPTLEERLLGFRCRSYCEEPEAVRFGDVSPEVHNSERVVLLARRWSVDPVAASERLLQQEAVRSEGDDGSGE